MVAAVAPPTAIDIRTSASYPVKLGASILKDAESKRFRSVRYNHKPELARAQDTVGRLVATKDDTVQLRVRAADGENGYRYAGRPARGEDTYVLVSKATGSGKDRELVLERLSGSHDLNLISTPDELDARTLAKQYRQLDLDDHNEDELFGDDEDGIEAPIDRNNPFDFRNYLQPAKSKVEAADTPRSAATIPQPPHAATSTPTTQPRKPVASSTATLKKRKAPEVTKPNPKRVKAGQEPPLPEPSSKPKAKTAAIPSVRIDRKASVRRSSFDDSGELILENETPISEKPPRGSGAMALALSGQLGQGPISLRSAASSPGSRVASPMPPRPEGIESPAEFELGESSPDHTGTARKSPARDAGDYFSNADEEDEDADADADVEDLELPSPVQTDRRKSVAGAGFNEVVDEEDDMERQLELALAQDDGAMVQPTVLAESDEESEEE